MRYRPSYVFFVGVILISFLQDLSRMTVEATRHSDSHQTTEKRSNGGSRFQRRMRHHNKVDATSTHSMHSYPKAGLRILVGRPYRTMSEATLYRLLPYEAVENTNTPERQIYQYKIFYGSKFTPHKKNAHYKKHGHQTYPYHLKHKASRRLRHGRST